MSEQPAPVPRNDAPSASAILIVATLVVAGSAMLWGSFSEHGLALLLCALALGVWLHFRPLRGLPPPETLLLGMLLLFLTLGSLLNSGMNERCAELPVPRTGQVVIQLNGFGVAIKLLSVAALALGLTFLRGGEEKGGFAKARFLLLVLIALAQRPLILASTTAPEIDVFISQTEGAKGFFEGKNVYSMIFTPSYEGEIADHYGYPPAAFYPVVLSWKLVGDVRGAWIVCDLLAAFCLYRLARRSRSDSPLFARLLTLAFLFLPRSLFVLEQSWTEPLVLATMGGFALAYARGAGSTPLGLLMGLWLSSKQYVALAVPFLVKLLRARLNVWLWAVAGGAALVLPFALWDLQALRHDVVTWFLTSEGRADALSIYGALLRHGIEIPGPLVTALWLGGLALFTWRMPRTLAGLLFGVGSMWLYFFLFGKQAFLNYYHLIIFAFLLAAAASPRDAEAPP